MTKQVEKTKTKPQSPSSGKNFAMSSQNYKLLAIGFGIIVLGFILMAGGGSDDPTQFSDKIFSFRRITLAPIVVLFGFAFEIYAIMKRPKKS